MKKTTTLAISISLLGLLWIFAVFAYTMTFSLPFLCWGSIAFMVLVILIADVYLIALRKDPDGQSTEPDALGIIATLVFVVIAAILNTAFVLLGRGDFNLLLLTLNLVAIVCYVILLVWMEHSSDRLADQLEKTEKKAAPSINIAKKLGDLLAITEDAEVRGRLLKLKEAVDYGTTISTDTTVGAEAQMGALLDEITQLTITRADPPVILNKLEMAEMTWKLRSSAASSVR